jgi:hypothetical protein
VWRDETSPALDRGQSDATQAITTCGKTYHCVPWPVPANSIISRAIALVAVIGITIALPCLEGCRLMQFIDLLSALLVVGIAAWLINSRIRTPGNIKTILNAVLALIVVGMALWLINTYVPMAGELNRFAVI